MGTSKGFGGPASGLVPSWADDPASGASPVGPPAGSDGVPPASPPAAPVQPAPPAQAARPLTQARARFTRFSKTGSSSALGGALRRHVDSVGGAAAAARRMGASRVAASNLLGVVRDAQRIGVSEALRSRGLQQLIGLPAEQVYLGLLDTICLPGGPVDEGISRQALLDAIEDQADAGVVNFDDLTPDQLKEFFLDYVIRSIEGKVISDIAAKGISVPENAERVLELEGQLKDFIAGATRSHIGELLEGPLTAFTDPQINEKVSQIYEAAFSFVEQAGEEAE
jgi:hypothetical protein